MTISRVAVVLLWIILVFSQLGLHFAVHGESSSRHGHPSFRSAPPRKVWVFDTASSFPAPSTSPKFSGNEDEKRVVHTGPNPLHN
ncbi:hypothetical protein V6N13_124516 [Hibiscus sabdariffa]|uniref:Uncharacterized protein n=1 Tax=Hibiscus sabdariffa TaxID=183260 RepID=A0ABR2S233_9ROSI